REEEARRAEAERQERERQRLKEEEERHRAIAEAARKAQEEAEAAAALKKREEKARPPEQRPVAYHHTVKRGETLPQIAAQADVYGDMTLWPLIYRANRDQISDPRRIWPGQVLKIPRSLGRDEIVEARRYARERPLY
ncbi:MAG TPA: LysM peptidoglycan-binding domain-containing protein, partial [Geobacteraceae bacterium]